VTRSEIDRLTIQVLAAAMEMTELAEAGRLSERASHSLVAICDHAKAELGPREKSAEGGSHRTLEHAAQSYHKQARETGRALDLSIARMLEAAWQAEVRRQYGNDEAGIVADLDKLSREADKYLATCGEFEERLLDVEPAPAPGEARMHAVRSLLSEASACKRAFAQEPTAFIAGGVACALVMKVHRLGLGRGEMGVRSSWKSKRWLKAKLLSAPSARDDQLASWALQACGVWSKDADNWIGSAMRARKASDT
jgi:hypothetical protein